MALGISGRCNSMDKSSEDVLSRPGVLRRDEAGGRLWKVHKPCCHFSCGYSGFPKIHSKEQEPRKML